MAGTRPQGGTRRGIGLLLVIQASSCDAGSVPDSPQRPAVDRRRWTLRSISMRMSAAARTVLMIPGAGGGGWEWGIWQRVFEAAGWRVFAPDLVPGEGGL